MLTVILSAVTAVTEAQESNPVLVTAAYLSALIVIGGGVFAIYRLARRIDAAIGVDAAGRTLSDRMTRDENHLWPDSGEGPSLADRVADVTDKIDDVDTSVKAMQAEQQIIKSLLTTALETRGNPGRPSRPRH